MIPMPSLADIGYLLLPPLALAGIWSLLLRARARAVPRTLCGRRRDRRAGGRRR